MSYDLVLWRGAKEENPSLVWMRLREDEEVVGVEPLGASEVVAAFRGVFGSRVKVDDRQILGPGFELGVEDGARYVRVTCSWGLLGSREGEEVIFEIYRVAERLRATFFDPQTAEAPPPDQGFR